MSCRYTAEEIARIYPIGALVRYTGTNTVTLLRYSTHQGRPLRDTPLRREVRELSRKSLARLTFLINTANCTFQSMLTLNYLSPPVSGKKAKNDLRYVIGWLKRCPGWSDIGYLWFAEFTKNGTIHFHILLTEKVTQITRNAFADYWVKISKQGSGGYCSLRNKKLLDVETVITVHNQRWEVWQNAQLDNGLKRYAVMYATKPYQKVVPAHFRDIGRFWGASQNVRNSVEVAGIEAITENEVRNKLRQGNNPSAEWDVLPKYIWTYPNN